MQLADLGYDEFFEAGRAQSGFASLPVARVVAEHRESYRVMTEAGERSAKVTGKQMFTAASREEYPAVGDWVAIEELNAEQAVIEAVLPRRTVLKRKEAGGSGMQIIAANVDTAFIVQAVGRDFNINRFERYAALVTAGGVLPVLVLNKSDLATPAELDEMLAKLKERLPAIETIAISTVSKDGLEALRARLLEGKTYCLLGSSGVGKSSVINELLGEELLATGKVSARTDKGMHVTTARSLIALRGGALVVDTPGMRELGVLDSEEGIGQVFDEIVELEKSCRFSDCTHASEPGCAVRAAIGSGTLDERQYRSYEKLKRENGFSEMTDLERRGKDKAFGKFLKKAKEQIKKYPRPR